VAVTARDGNDISAREAPERRLAPYPEIWWSVACRAAEDAGRDPGALRRAMRINRASGTWAQAVEEAAATGVQEAFVDLTYSTRGVDEALSVAADLASAYFPSTP
jgi:hypothetical protein